MTRTVVVVLVADGQSGTNPPSPTLPSYRHVYERRRFYKLGTTFVCPQASAFV